MQHAHQKLVVHRDLKPGNIMVTADGTPKLLDFGIAKLLTPDPGEAVTRTETAVRLMTPDYASPEQVRGGAITTATDVYALGVVLYELLTARASTSVQSLLAAGNRTRDLRNRSPASQRGGAPANRTRRRNWRGNWRAIWTTSCSWRCAKNRSAATNRSNNFPKTFAAI